MHLRAWLTETNTSIKALARAVPVERAMIYRYFQGTIPRARTIRRIEIITGGAVTAQDFYTSALRQMNEPGTMDQAPRPAPSSGAATGAIAAGVMPTGVMPTGVMPTGVMPTGAMDVRLLAQRTETPRMAPEAASGHMPPPAF